MARGQSASTGRAARSEGLSPAEPSSKKEILAPNEVVLNWMKAGTTVIENDEIEALDEKQNTMMANIADAQNVLAKRDRAEYVRMLGGEDNAKKVDDMIARGVMRRDLVRKDGLIDQQERFNKELKEAGDVPLAKNDPILVRAIENYYASQIIGRDGEANTPTYERLAQGGNGYVKTRSFEPVYNKELKAWELVRYANPLLNSDDPKDYYTEKGWFAIKGSPNDKTLLTKLKKVAIVMNTFVED